MRVDLTAEGFGMVEGWSIDTRTLQPRDLYFALRGPVHDGHDFASLAWEKGAVGVVADHAMPGRGALHVVPDTLAELQRISMRARKQWGGTVVGVTGSAGKTTTKDVIAHLLSSDLAVGKTIGNFNNHVGVPLSILRLPDDCEVAVLEMGMNHAGEIRELARIAEPQVGVVTNVGYAHVENFGCIAGIAAAKRELIDGLADGGTAVLNADDARVLAFREKHRGPVVTFGIGEIADVRAEDIEMDSNGTRFTCEGVALETPLTGRHGLSNVLAGIATARVFGIETARLRDAIGTLALGKMRGARSDINGITILDDSYNSNPEAAKSMLDVLRATPAARRIAVLGEMRELGPSAEALHREVGRYVAERGLDVLIGIRGAARYMVDEAVKAGLSGSAAYFFEDSEPAGDLARELAKPGDAILFKGSRGVQVERALRRLSEGPS